MNEMVPLSALLWPILLSTIIVFIASSVSHMLLPWHRSDYPALPNEEGFRKAVGPMNIPPGDYFVPRPAARSEMQAPAFLAKLNEGPRIIMTVLPNGTGSLAKPLVGWFFYCLVVNFFASHVAATTLAPGTPYRYVFHTVGLTALLGYVAALWQARIWFNKSWSITIKSSVDGLIYATLVAGTFGWLWPK